MGAIRGFRKANVFVAIVISLCLQMSHAKLETPLAQLELTVHIEFLFKTEVIFFGFDVL